MYFLNSKAEIGWIEVITGCMFAGKTEEFIRRLVRLSYAKFEIQVFKPTIDNRYSENQVVSHSKKAVEAISVKDSDELLANLKTTTNVAGIDEVQFFDNNIVKIADSLADKGIIVIVNGLDKDFRGEAFTNIEQLMTRAEEVKKLHAICVKCGNLANRTQRLINGKPANYYDPIVLIGEKDKYEARCRHCHEVTY
ncbi:thymidine kinase [Spiroplasma citri]|uniref:Thymidine kinase n=1 Tax=Spiroplasma citri TaxID=2133 RepID=Q14QE3_SPICI|nr:thymidine kinase [Spiroplasma citri]APE73977.1 thymidine kinase [Spiroplasma citri]QED23979.1 thymidine kinase [Spiroplasma citri]QIA66263.1 thymidine kinase [Spiroplasma citri]QIA68115.1 thymidine kinase [Spiroplasma citri]QIA69992.1 thymidine kinase [Spiroplasma citri]